MFADEEMEQDDSNEQPAEEESESSADDAWTTAPEMEKVGKETIAASSKAEKADEEEGWAKAGRQPTVDASSTGEKEKPAISAAKEVPSAVSDSNSEKFPGSLLSSIGIEDPDTQRWVLIGAGVLIVLCCACACIGAIAYAWSNF